MLRIPRVLGNTMYFHMLPDKISQQSKRVSALQLARCVQLTLRPLSADTKPAARDEDLPRQPVPKLTDTFCKFLRSVKPLVTEDELRRTEDVIQDFLCTDAPMLQEVLEERVKHLDNWMSDWWLKYAYLAYRISVVINSSPGLVFPKQKFESEEDFLCYAADFTYAALTYKVLIDTDKLPPDVAGKQRFDMSQYKRMFEACRIPAPEVDTMHFPDRCTPPKYIVVVYKNHFYKVYVFDECDNLLSANAIYNQLEHIVGECTKPAVPVGILTAEHRDTWACVYLDLMKDKVNKKSVEEIQKSIFVLCLDGPSKQIIARNDVSKAGMRMIHGGGSQLDGGNRWFDKALQMIVSCDGQVGITVEHSPAEAVPMAMLMNYCLDFLAKKGDDNKPGASETSVPEPEKLEFCLNSELQEAIDEAKCNLDELAESCEFFLCTYKKYGKNTIKEFKLSPDSFIQIAIQFAYIRLHCKPAAHYESAGLRKFYLGRTECIRTCSCEAVAFAELMMDEYAKEEDKRAALIEAVNYHKEYTAMAMNGKAVDRHLFGLKVAAIEECKIEPHKFFKDPAYVRSTHFNITTSQVAGKGDSVMCYGPVVPDGYGCCYNPMSKGINFGLSAFNIDNKDTNVDAFHDALFKSLDEMGEIMSCGAKSKL